MVSETNEKRMYILLIKTPNIHHKGERKREKEEDIIFDINVYILLLIN